VEKRASHPLIPFGVLRIDSLFTLACISAGWSSFGIFVFYALDLLEVLREQTPLLTPAQMTTIAISGLFAARATGLFLNNCRTSTVMLISMTFFLIGVSFSRRCLSAKSTGRRHSWEFLSFHGAWIRRFPLPRLSLVELCRANIRVWLHRW
jgi:hypothetical protein